MHPLHINHKMGGLLLHSHHHHFHHFPNTEYGIMMDIIIIIIMNMVRIHHWVEVWKVIHIIIIIEGHLQQQVGGYYLPLNPFPQRWHIHSPPSTTDGSNNIYAPTCIQIIIIIIHFQIEWMYEWGGEINGV